MSQQCLRRYSGVGYVTIVHKYSTIVHLDVTIVYFVVPP